jgi:hypothetical protein
MRKTWLLLLLAGCTPPPLACTFPGTSPMLVAQLYFGRANIPDNAWATFAADTLTPSFPDGFTALDAAGQWREAPDKRVEREPSKLVIVAAPDTATTRDNLGAVIAAYKTRFNQKSVGLILDTKCASF